MPFLCICLMTVRAVQDELFPFAPVGHVSISIALIGSLLLTNLLFSNSFRWALLYTLPGQAKGDVRRDALQQAMAASYDFFYK